MLDAADKVKLLEADADLGRELPAEQARDARLALAVSTVEAEPGPWSPDALVDDPACHLGLLVLSGLIARDVTVAGATATELLGPGDVLEPGTAETNGSFVSARIEWSIVEPALVAVLDRRFGRDVARWPEVTSALNSRLAQRATRLCVQRAIAHISRVEDRLLALLWHLAERHGRVGLGGVILPLPMRHRSLGRLVGASRSTVTLAVGELERRGAIARRVDGGWLLVERLPDAAAASDMPVARQRRPARPSLPNEHAVRDAHALRTRFDRLSTVYQEQRLVSAAVARRSETLRHTSLLLRRSLRPDDDAAA